ncbi:RHS repeat domain-containing protein, partial [Pararcticibacter amylolyticus]
GWLKGTSSAEFSQTLNYEEGSRYNGDITSVNWTLAGSSKTFSYSYDPLNRLTSGTSPDMSENNISYDNLGNLLSMTRDGKTLGYDYTYDGARGNRLNAVSGTWFNGTKYFRYDVNGNVTRDDSRGISSISYNHLNLPQQVSSVSGTLLSYSYTATGEKLRSYNSKTGTTTDYVGGTRYENNDLKVVLTEEGQLRRSGNSYSYEYWVKDHLGNTRVAFYRNPSTGQLEVLQREDYYPFGLNKVRGSLSSSKTNYLYNGKELQEGFDLLDYGARFYDAVVGRWTSVDPLAEKMASWSLYTYAFNNPLRFIDIGGMIPYPITVRAFHPDKYFGGGYSGDNRGYTTAPATARVTQRLLFDTDKSTLTSQAWSSKTHALYGTFESRAMPKQKISSFTSSTGSDGAKHFGIEAHVASANPLAPPGTPDVDVFSSLSITSKDNTLSITGKLTGDNFPSTEAFVSDPSGQSVFLGIGLKEGNPYQSLWGTNKENPIANISLSLTTDDKGNFTGVSANGKTYTIADWNKQFQQQDPHRKRENK